MNYTSTPILIPAYKPDEKLTKLVTTLIESGAGRIVIVNDGSGKSYDKIFQKLKVLKDCTILNHVLNLGKGRALKTGLNYIASEIPTIRGVVTADADGQHLPKDILKVAKALEHDPGYLILGCRRFSQGVPIKNRLANIFMRELFRLVVGNNISDTQTGLRGIPIEQIPLFVSLEGERYDYETNMLITASRNKIDIAEVPIQTVYIENNKSSHFRAIVDSIRVCSIFFRFSLSSITTSAIDYTVYYLFISTGNSIAISIVIARIISGSYNFLVNKNMVFKEKANYLFSFIKYWTLVFLLGTVAFIAITFLTKRNIMGAMSSKLLVESSLFVVSFIIQRDIVYNLRNPKK